MPAPEKNTQPSIADLRKQIAEAELVVLKPLADELGSKAEDLLKSVNEARESLVQGPAFVQLGHLATVLTNVPRDIATFAAQNEATLAPPPAPVEMPPHLPVE